MGVFISTLALGLWRGRWEREKKVHVRKNVWLGSAINNRNESVYIYILSFLWELRKKYMESANMPPPSPIRFDNVMSTKNVLKAYIPVVIHKCILLASFPPFLSLIIIIIAYIISHALKNRYLCGYLWMYPSCLPPLLHSFIITDVYRATRINEGKTRKSVIMLLVLTKMVALRSSGRRKLQHWGILDEAITRVWKEKSCDAKFDKAREHHW